MKLLWTRNASKNIEGIFGYISQSSRNYALMVVERIIKRAVQILQFPQSGRIVPEMQNSKIREVIEGPYRIIYLIKPEQIEIIGVIHGAQRFPWKTRKRS